MQSGGLCSSQKHDAQEARFEEKRGEDFVKQQGTGNTPGKLRETAPVGAELIGHHQA